MAFGSNFNNFFNGVYEGMTTSDDLKDYRHASKLFLSDGYALAPQNKFLFHVYFTLNTAEIPGLRQAFSSVQDTATIGMLVKTADLPRFSFDVEEFNQYNRKRYVQSKINYEPVQITFHDDGSDLVRSMWNAYYTYYYEDSLHQYDNISADSDLSGSTNPLDFNRRDIYDNLRNVNNWGYSGTGNASGYKPNFFKDIKIYGLNRGNFTQYTLINPIITDWSHDQFDHANGNGVMQNSMTLRYETVKYARGKIGDNVKGFADSATYDTEPSMFGKAGSVPSIFGEAGLLDAGVSIYDDLASGNILGAFVTGATAYETFQDVNIGEVFTSEGSNVLGNTLVALAGSPTVTNSLNNLIFPKPEVASPGQNQGVISNNGLTYTGNWQNPDISNTSMQPTGSYNLQGTQPADVNSNGSTTNVSWFDTARAYAATVQGDLGAAVDDD